MPSSRRSPQHRAPVPNAAPLAAAASIPVNLPPASSPASASDSAALERRGFDSRSTAGRERAAGRGRPVDEISDRPAVAARAGHQGPVGASDVGRRQTLARLPSRQAGGERAGAEGPWTKYQPAQPSQPAPVTRDPWERPENNNAPWLDYQAAKPETTVGAFIDPYANNSLADDARLVGGLADKAVRNVVNGATLGYGDKIAAGLDALTGRSPDYATALADERGRSAQAMAQPGGLGTAEQIAGMALPAGAIGRGAAALGEAASALPFGLGRLAASPLAQASATGAAVGGINAAGNDQPVAPNAVLGALAGAGGNALARSVARVLAGPAAAVAAPSTQAVKDTAQAAYNDAFQPGQIVAPEILAAALCRGAPDNGRQRLSSGPSPWRRGRYRRAQRVADAWRFCGRGRATKRRRDAARARHAAANGGPDGPERPEPFGRSDRQPRAGKHRSIHQWPRAG